MMEHSESPRILDVAVVIPTYNRRDSLLRTLDSIARQTFPANRFEVVVVDNNSNDRTSEAVTSFGARRQLRVKCVRETDQGVTYARNRGIRETSAPVVVFTDDDVEADPRWLEELMRGLERSGAAAAGGRTETVWEGPLPDWWLPDYDKLFARNWGDAPTRVTEFPFFYSQNFAVRRETLAAVGGFDPRLGPKASDYVAGEDADLCRRIHESGRMLYYLPQAIVRHRVGSDRLNRRFLRRRFYGSGVAHAIHRRIQKRPLEPAYQLRRVAGELRDWLVAKSAADRFRRELDVWQRAGFLRVWIGRRS